jgi:hypothetical protein
MNNDPFPHQEISDLAHHLWEVSTEKDLGPEHFWFEAERALMSKRQQPPPGAPVPESEPAHEGGGLSWTSTRR